MKNKKRENAALCRSAETVRLIQKAHIAIATLHAIFLMQLILITNLESKVIWIWVRTEANIYGEEIKWSRYARIFNRFVHTQDANVASLFV